MGPNGGWTANSGSRTGMDNRNSRIPGAARGGKPNAHGGHGNRGDYERHGFEDPRQRESGLPPKPPAPAYQTWAGPAGRDGRDGRVDQRRDRANQGRFGGRMEPNSYVPNYGPGGDRVRNRDDYNSSFPHHANRRNQRDYPPRRRSRSPGFRHGGHGVDRALYRR